MFTLSLSSSLTHLFPILPAQFIPTLLFSSFSYFHYHHHPSFGPSYIPPLLFLIPPLPSLPSHFSPLLLSPSLLLLSSSLSYSFLLLLPIASQVPYHPPPSCLTFDGARVRASRELQYTISLQAREMRERREQSTQMLLLSYSHLCCTVWILFPPYSTPTVPLLPFPFIPLFFNPLTSTHLNPLHSVHPPHTLNLISSPPTIFLFPSPFPSISFLSFSPSPFRLSFPLSSSLSPVSSNSTPFSPFRCCAQKRFHSPVRRKECVWGGVSPQTQRLSTTGTSN